MSTVYAQRWLRCWSLATAFGVGLSFLLWPLQSIVLLWAAVFLSATPLLSLPGSSPEHGPDWLRGVARAGLLATAMLAAIAVAGASGWLAFILILVAALSSPWVVARMGTRLSDTLATVMPEPGIEAECAPPEPQPTSPRCGADVLRAMSNHELCMEWRRTFVRLQRASCAQDMGDVVIMRQLLLDEMDRRCPEGLGAWMESGARAAGGPDRFLKDAHGATGSEAA
jgi:hypothetical protein